MERMLFREVGVGGPAAEGGGWAHGLRGGCGGWGCVCVCEPETVQLSQPVLGAGVGKRFLPSQVLLLV